jgi:putative glutamine amidotransferase
MLGISETYVKAVVAAGGIPLFIPVGLGDEDLRTVFSRVDGLLLPGGGDVDPALYTGEQPHTTLRGLDNLRDGLEMYMARAAVDLVKPVLAICRGHQVFNVALGGSLWQDLGSQMPGAIGHDHPAGYPRNLLQHQVEVRTDSHLARCLASDRVSVNSLHHQGIRDLAPGLVASAIAPDGLIEGVEIADHPFAIGVQWHPEDLVWDDPAMLSLFRGFVEAASGREPVGSLDTVAQPIQ